MNILINTVRKYTTASITIKHNISYITLTWKEFQSSLLSSSLRKLRKPTIS